MKINIEGNLITTTADSELHVVISGARGPQGEPSPLGVPYTGATQDVNLGEFGLLTGNIEFDNTPTNVPTTDGSMSWSDTDGTVNLRLKGGNVISKLGETQHLRVYNNTGVSMAKGKVVYVTGSQGQRLTVALADADTELLSKDTIGITAEAIADQREGFIIIAGVLTNISTTGFLDGDTVFLSQTAGNYTKTPPADPAHLVILGFVVKGGSGGAGSIYVKVDNGYELEELHNVSDAAKTSVVDNDAFLLRDSADNNLWKRLTWSNLKAAVKTYLDTFKGVAGGYASLDGSGKVPASELPSYVDDVIEVANYAALPVTGETGKIYITLDNNKSYRWSGSVYVEIAGTPAWGAITGTLSNQTDLQNALNAKQNTLTFDSTPTNGSTNPVTSDGVFDALALKQDTLTNPVTGTGASGQVSYWSGTGTQAGSNNLFWDAANNRLSVGTNASIAARLSIRGAGTTSATTALLVQNSTPTALFNIKDDGSVGVNTTSQGSTLQINTLSASTIGLIVQGAASQTANIAEFRNSSSQLQTVVHGGNSGFSVYNSDGSQSSNLTFQALSLYTNRFRITSTTSQTNIFPFSGTLNFLLVDNTFTTAFRYTNDSPRFFGASSGEQILVQMDVRTQQTGTAGYSILKINQQTETSTGSGEKSLLWIGKNNINYVRIDNVGKTIFNDVDIEFATTTGTKIGTATNQKLSFFNATPVVQQTGDIPTALSNLGLVSSPTLPESTGGKLYLFNNY